MQKQNRNLRLLSLIILTMFLLSLPVMPGSRALAATSEDGDWQFTAYTSGQAIIDKYLGSGGDVTIPSTLAGSPVTSIRYDAFKNCTSLTGITIPNSITSIGSSAFSGCTSLTSVTIPNSITDMGNRLFFGCTSLTKVTISNKVIILDSGTFSGCTALTSVTIPNSVINIRYDAFKNCTSLTSITIPNSVTDMGTGVFSGCTALTNVTLSNNILDITSGMFENCTSLTTLTIPNGVQTIQGNLSESAFSGCTALTKLTIPKTLTYFAYGVFEDCSNLTIYCYKNSSAHQFSINENIPFVLLPDPTYKVTFNSKGGSAVSEKTVAENSTVKKPGDPKRKGYIFEGWYKESACITAWNFDRDIVTGNITLYAKWTAIKAYITPTSNTISKGGTLKLTAIGNASIQSASWTTSKKANVKIESGAKKQTVTLKGMKKGNSIITAVITFKDGTKKTVKRTVTTK